MGPALFLALFLGATLSTWGGCFRPAIEDGGLFCADGSRCPEGFGCVFGKCFKGGVVDGGRAEVRVEAGPDRISPPLEGGVEVGDGSCVPAVPVVGCVPQVGLACDPVCQTGCCAGQKCTAMNTGGSPGGAATLGCGPVNPPPRGLGQTCDASNSATPNRADNCAPGLTCIDGNNGSLCFKLCRDDVDCGSGTTCEQRAIEARSGSPVASVCSLPSTPCDPTKILGSGCPSPRICYLIASDRVNGDTTVCEITSGDRKNASCSHSRECLTGYTCAAGGAMPGYCLPACLISAPVCPNNTNCQTTGKLYDSCF